MQSKIGGCPKSDHAKMLVCIGIYSVFRGSVDHGGGVPIYIYSTSLGYNATASRRRVAYHGRESQVRRYRSRMRLAHATGSRIEDVDRVGDPVHDPQSVARRIPVDDI